MSVPSKTICPLRAGVSPSSDLHSVVLPTPLRPRSAVTLPLSTPIDTPCRTWLSP
jgi:hypothetical protein